MIPQANIEATAEATKENKSKIKNHHPRVQRNNKQFTAFSPDTNPQCQTYRESN